MTVNQASRLSFLCLVLRKLGLISLDTSMSTADRAWRAAWELTS